jgi:hypothetical protein
MKKLNHNGLFMMIAFAFLSMSSCTDKEIDNSIQVGFNVNKSNEVAIQNINTAMLFSPLKLEGKFDAWVSHSNELVVLTKTDKNLHLFVVQGIKNNQIDLRNVESLTFLNHAMMLEEVNQGTLYFGVSNNNKEKTLKRLPNDILGNITHKEFGTALIHQAIDFKDDFAKNLDISTLKKSENVIEYLFGSESTRSAACNSGGSGSTSCSNSYCSVECASGYYACCTLPDYSTIPYTKASCTCIKAIPDQ